MANATIQHVSTLTAKYQTTIPSAIRRELGLKQGDSIYYCVNAQGQAILSADPIDEHEDPALAPFLDLLERDIVNNPQNLIPFEKSDIERIEKLLGRSEFDYDINAPLSPEDD